MPRKSAGIGDVNLSQTEQSNQTTEQSLWEQGLSEIAKADSETVSTEYKIYKLVDTKRNAPVNIDGIDDVINPKTGRPERIWLLSGADSIWQTDLVELLKDKNYVSQNRRSLRFESKILRIPLWDKLAIEFADACRHNIGNPNRKTGSKLEFFEYDPQKQAKAALDKEMLELDMAILAKETDATTMMKHASFLGIQMIDELGRPKTEDGVRREYMLAAKRNPQLFKKTVGSKEVEVHFMVKKCVLDAKIDIGRENNTAYWSNDGGVICKIPTNRKTLEYLVEFALTNSREGQEFQNNLKRFSN